MSSYLKSELEFEFGQLEKKSNQVRKSNKIQGQKLRERLPPQRHGIKKQLKRLKTENSKPKYVNPGKKIKFSFHDFADKKAADEKIRAQIESNIDKIVNFSEATKKISTKSAKAVVEHTEKSKRSYTPKSRNFDEKFGRKKSAKTDPTGTVFTEDDFEKFSKEYFLNSKPIHPNSLIKKKVIYDD